MNSRAALFFLTLSLIASAANAQEQAASLGDHTRSLLAVSAKARSWREIKAQTLPPSFGFDERKTAAMARLLLQRKATQLPELLPHLDNDAETLTLVTESLKKIRKNLSESALQNIDRWLLQNDPRRREDLKKAAAALDVKDQVVIAEWAINALLSADPNAARALLESKVKSDNADLALYANSQLTRLLLKQPSLSADDQKTLKTRRQLALKHFAQKPLSAFKAHAIHSVLLSHSWPEQLGFLVQALQLPALGYGDFETLAPNLHTLQLTEALTEALRSALQSSDDQNVRDNSLRLLIQSSEDWDKALCQQCQAWIEQPSWSQCGLRQGFLEALYELQVTEHKATVQKLCLGAKDLSGLSSELWLLAHWADSQDSALGELLLKAFQQSSDSDHRRVFVQALIRTGALTPEAAGKRLQAFLDYANQPVNAALIDSFAPYESLPEAEHDLGYALSSGDAIPASWLPQLGSVKALRELVCSWPHGQALTLLLDDVAQGSFAPAALTQKLRQALSPEQAKEHSQSALDWLKAHPKNNGAAAKLARLFLSQDSARESVLGTGSAEHQAFALACARLKRQRLPLAAVGAALKSDSEALRDSAWAYLRAWDSEASERLMRDHAKGQIVILGARSDRDTAQENPELDALEVSLAQELKAEDGPSEIFVLSRFDEDGPEGDLVVRIKGGQALLTYYPENSHFRIGVRVLPKDQWAALKVLLAGTRFEQMPPYNSGLSEGYQYQYLHLSKNSEQVGGRRVRMISPPLELLPEELGQIGQLKAQQVNDVLVGLRLYGRVCREFLDLLESPELKTVYPGLKAIPTASVVIDKDGLNLIDIKPHKDHGFVVCGQTTGSLKQSWHPIKDNQLRAALAESKSYSQKHWLSDIPEGMTATEHFNHYPWQVQAGESRLRVGVMHSQSGLWFCRAGSHPQLLFAGHCAYPVINAKQSWALVSVAGDGDWSKPCQLVRLRLTDGQVQAVQLAPAHVLSPCVYLKEHNAFLVVRHRGGEAGVGPELPEFYLVSGETGRVERALGEFRPWLHTDRHELQETQKAGVYWAAIPDIERKVTHIGLYDAKTFRFDQRASYEGLVFDSMDQYVDIDKGRVFVTYEGALLSLPLK